MAFTPRRMTDILNIFDSLEIDLASKGTISREEANVVLSSLGQNCSDAMVNQVFDNYVMLNMTRDQEIIAMNPSSVRELSWIDFVKAVANVYNLLTLQHVALARKYFERFDNNKNGKLERHELVSLLSSLLPKESNEHINELVSIFFKKQKDMVPATPRTTALMDLKKKSSNNSPGNSLLSHSNGGNDLLLSDSKNNSDNNSTEEAVTWETFINTKQVLDELLALMEKYNLEQKIPFDEDEENTNEESDTKSDHEEEELVDDTSLEDITDLDTKTTSPKEAPSDKFPSSISKLSAALRKSLKLPSLEHILDNLVEDPENGKNKLKDIEKEFKAKEAALKAKEKELLEKQEELDRRQSELDRRQEEMDRRQEEMDRRQEEMDRRHDELDRRHDELDRREKELEQREEKHKEKKHANKDLAGYENGGVGTEESPVTGGRSRHSLQKSSTLTNPFNRFRKSLTDPMVPPTITNVTEIDLADLKLEEVGTSKRRGIKGSFSNALSFFKKLDTQTKSETPSPTKKASSSSSFPAEAESPSSPSPSQGKTPRRRSLFLSKN
jgi:Ca2+-binding EF-hand superfamily protein